MVRGKCSNIAHLCYNYCIAYLHVHVRTHAMTTTCMCTLLHESLITIIKINTAYM